MDDIASLCGRHLLFAVPRGIALSAEGIAESLAVLLSSREA